ncbi:MAG: hypothetical protein ABI444_02505 [Candidatus Kapaibacterium sp.]|jgi:hypothetical protein
MTSRTFIRFAPLQIAVLTAITLCGCSSPTESPSRRVKSVLHASGAIYGTPFSFNDTTLDADYSPYTSTQWWGPFNQTTHVDRFSFHSVSETGGYGLSGYSQWAKDRTRDGNQIQIRQTTDASDEQQSRTIDKQVFTFTEATLYSKIAGSFELRWHYKDDTTRVGYVTGTFSYEKQQ